MRSSKDNTHTQQGDADNQVVEQKDGRWRLVFLKQEYNVWMAGQQKMMDHGTMNTPWMLNKSYDDQIHLHIEVLYKNHDTEVGPSSKHLSRRKGLKRVIAGVKVGVRVDVPREIRIPPFYMPLDPLDTSGLRQEYYASHLPIHGAYNLHIKSFGFPLSNFVVTICACGPQMDGFQPSCSYEVAWTYDLQM